MLICLLIHIVAPSSESLMYFPESWNPLKMVSSSVAHADWMHIAGNLLFFYAFSPMLEVAVNNKKQYFLILLALAVITSISYSLFSVLTSDNIPSLGLSGVVMGVIGLAAYMMPKAKIVTYIWFVTYLKNHYVAAWVLALWYIGWDILDLFSSGQNTGINLISHVSGGVSGYLIGYFFLNKQKIAIKDDLDEAIEYARSNQEDYGMASTYKGNRKEMVESIRYKDSIREYKKSIDNIYQQVQLNRDSDAIILMLQGSEEKQYSIEIYDELFERMLQWDVSRTLMCTARFCIDIYMHNRNYRRPLEIATHCYSIFDDFVLADPMHVLILAKYAISVQQYESAYVLVKNAEQRYGEHINHTLCKLLEVEVLWVHLNKHDEARKLLTDLLKATHSSEHHNTVMELAKTML
jgi:membrane associated rhomboid family serine protease